MTKQCIDTGDGFSTAHASTRPSFTRPPPAAVHLWRGLAAVPDLRGCRMRDRIRSRASQHFTAGRAVTCPLLGCNTLNTRSYLTCRLPHERDHPLQPGNRCLAPNFQRHSDFLFKNSGGLPMSSGTRGYKLRAVACLSHILLFYLDLSLTFHGQAALL